MEEVGPIRDRFWGMIPVIMIAIIHTNTALAEPPRLSLPLQCQPGRTCFIQNYVDVDPSSEVGDYHCSKSSYDGHKGVDFRLLSVREMRRGVAVLAAAAGVVKALRDGMADRLVTASGTASIKGRECGNGLVIDHGDGWETQYCHMLKGSMVIDGDPLKKGDPVKRGQRIGFVGLSGETSFPHVHLVVRHNGLTIDPFSGAHAGNRQCGPHTTTGALWQKSVLAAFPYISGQLLHMGFAKGAVQKEILMRNGGVPAPRSIKSPAMVFYGQALNLQKDDRLAINLSGPNGPIANALSDPMERHKASYLFFAGKKRIHVAWPRGTYKGVLSLLRKGKLVWKKTSRLKLR